MRIQKKGLIMISFLSIALIIVPMLVKPIAINLSTTITTKSNSCTLKKPSREKTKRAKQITGGKNNPAEFIQFPEDDKELHDFFVQFKKKEDFSDFLLSKPTVRSTFNKLNSVIISNISSSLLREEVKPFEVNYLTTFRNTKLKIKGDDYNSLIPLTGKERVAKATPQSLSTLQAINGSSLWNQGYKGAGMKIAILDTGINEEHVDFKGRICAKYSFVREEFGYTSEELTIEDNHGHGSHVAGIAAGNGTGNNEYSGIAPEAELIIAKVAGQDGFATLEGIIAAFNWALGEEADVINLSFGSEDYPTVSPLHNILETIVEGGITVTISAGNEGGKGRYTISLPGSEEAVITVGACDLTESKAPFSSIGPTVHQTRKPDLLAPGVQITAPSHTGNNYATKSGTSMASPLVAGAAALLIQALKEEGFRYNPGVIKAALMKTANTQGYLDPNYNGRGMINLGAAKDHVINAPCTTEKLPIILAINPITLPNTYYTTLPKGQSYIEHCTVISSNPNKTAIELSPSLENYCFASDEFNHYTEDIPVEITIPKDSPKQELTGLVTFTINDKIVQNLTIEITLVNYAGEFGLDLYHCHWPENYFMGKYCEFIRMAMMKGIVINIIDEPITEESLEEVDCLWMPDPCNIEYPGVLEGDLTSQTFRPISESEEMAIVNYVAIGGGLFVNFPGRSSKEIAGEVVDYETNVTALSELTTNWGITISDVYRSDDPTSVPVYNQTHPLSEGISFLSYYGTHLSVSEPSSTILVKANYLPTIVSHEEENDGKVLISSTSAFIENDGYKGLYEGFEQNNEFCEQILAWFVTRYTLELEETIATDQTKIDFKLSITKLGDPTIPENPPSGQVIRNSSEEISNLTLNYLGLGQYVTTYYFSADGNYTFRFSVENQTLETTYFRDITPPEITTPHEELTVTSETEIYFKIVDNYTPSPTVEIELHEEPLIVTKINATTFKVDILPENYPPGAYELIIQAMDDKENFATKTITLIFPDLSTMTSPASNPSTESSENITILVLLFSAIILSIISRVVQKSKRWKK